MSNPNPRAYVGDTPVQAYEREVNAGDLRPGDVLTLPMLGAVQDVEGGTLFDASGAYRGVRVTLARDPFGASGTGFHQFRRSTRVRVRS